MSAGNGYFMVKFDLDEDRSKVIDGGPWMINGDYLAVKKWTPDFNPSEACFGRTMVWVHFSMLNFMYYDERMLKVIAEGVGKPIRFDLTTAKLEEGNFARVYVELDLISLVVRRVWIQDHWHEVEFESLHMICSYCNHYGHVTRDCDMKNSGPSMEDGSKLTEENQPEKERIVAVDLVEMNCKSNDGENLANHCTSNLNENMEREWQVVHNQRSRNCSNQSRIEDMGPVVFNESSMQKSRNKHAGRNGKELVQPNKNGLMGNVGPKGSKDFSGSSKVVNSSKGAKIVFSAMKPSGVIIGGRIVRKTSGPKHISPQGTKPRVKRVRIGSPPSDQADTFKAIPL